MFYLKLYLLGGLITTWWCIRYLKSPLHQDEKPWVLGCFFMLLVWLPLVLEGFLKWFRDVPIEWCIDYFKLKLG